MRSADDDFDAAAEREIIELLAAVPRPEMPAEVRARIEDALAAEAGNRPGAGSSSRLAGGRWFALAAAAAVAVLAGFVVVPRLGGGTTASSPEAAPATALASASPSCTALAGDTADRATPVTESGTTYSASGLRTQAELLLRNPAPSCAAFSDGTAVSDTQRRVSPESVQACVTAVAKGRSIVAVDLGWYGQRPSVTMVLLRPKEALAVDCQRDPAAVLARADLP